MGFLERVKEALRRAGPRRNQILPVALLNEPAEPVVPFPSLGDALGARLPAPGGDRQVAPDDPGAGGSQSGGGVSKVSDRALSEQGFPGEIASAFDKTAQETNSVIMSRAPGKAVTSLVEHGHDLKCFQVKSKSCNWGPMSGFLCQLTCFNKAGSWKIGYNDKNYAKYFQFIREKQKEDASFKEAVQGGQTAFVPLNIFKDRKTEILRDPSVFAQKPLGTGEIVGLAAHMETAGDLTTGHSRHGVLASQGGRGSG